VLHETHVVDDEQTAHDDGHAPHEPTTVAKLPAQTAHDDVPFWTKQLAMAVVVAIQFPETFKAKPDPQIPDEHGLPAVQATVALAPTEAKWKPILAAEQAVDDV